MSKDGTLQTDDLRRALGPIQLVCLGIGAIIGVGIFVLTGQAAAESAGPAIVLSFVIAAIACALAGLCYAELASMMPRSGSAYTYSYAAFGGFAGWLVGWILILEYLAAAGAVSVGWSAYFGATLQSAFGLSLPAEFASAPIAVTQDGATVLTGAIFNVPAALIVLTLSVLLLVGVRISAAVNNLMVCLKLSVVIAVIAFGLPHINVVNLQPFIPENAGKFGEFGVSGILQGAGIIFFAYIGFDFVSGAAQEARNPQRDMPIGILGSLAICTVLYVLMALTITGLVSYKELGVANPMSVALGAGGPELAWLLNAVNVAAVVALTTVILVLIYGQTRIFHAMASDGLIPILFSRVHPTFKTPWLGTLATGAAAAVLGGFFDIKFLSDLVNMGTLVAFIFVCIAVLVLRGTRPTASRPFKVPAVRFVSISGVLVCAALLATFGFDSWLRFGGWVAIGVIAYLLYGARRAGAGKLGVARV